MSSRADDGAAGPPAGPPRWVELPDDRRTGFADLVDRGLTPELLVCAAAVRVGLAAGCAASLVIDPEQRYVLAATDATVAALAEAQFGVWQGPCPEAVLGDETIAVTDLADTASRWPRLAPRLTDLPRCALASVPLPGARGPVGVLTAYRPASRPFADSDLTDLAAVAAAVAALAGTRFSVSDASVRLPPSVLEMALGLVAVDRDVTEAEALDLLRARAEALGTTVGGLAEDVVRGLVPTESLGSSGPSGNAPGGSPA